MSKEPERREAEPTPSPLVPPAGRITDRIFYEPRPRLDDFHFGKETAVVFDDMLERSVPYYDEIQRMVGELVADFAVDGKNIYDLGCSTATTFLNLARLLPEGVEPRFIGVDSSPEMLEIAGKKLSEAGFARPFELRCGDLNRGVQIEEACVVLLVLTLQFIRPLRRLRLMREIHRGMTDEGCLILVEKVLGESSTFNRLYIKHYYEMKKRNGYSELEIAQKREALENVLIPYRLEENREMLQEAGFRTVDVFFKWYNFCGIVAMK
jgi:tRNA (cmo5U34)-methyltransferase